MAATMLAARRVEKPWGRHDLWPGFANQPAGSAPVGEIWFEAPTGEAADLLVKYLFTREKLSVQVHPDDAAAQAAGHRCGKDEAWVVLAAEPDAAIALGTRAPMDGAGLRAAALDGSIEALLDWKRVKAGDVFYSPARTVHAIGAGVTLVEVQQNLDLTYRLYDYGRPRPLHLDEAVAVADARPFVALPAPGAVGSGRDILVQGPKFVLERLGGGARHFSVPLGLSAWLVPLAGEGFADHTPWRAGQCLMLSGEVALLASAHSDLLLAYPGDKRM